jgi:hypothetical protein
MARKLPQGDSNKGETMGKAATAIFSIVLGIGTLSFISSTGASARSVGSEPAPGQINCTLSVTLTFSPPLTDAGGGSNPTTVSGTFKHCTEPAAAVKGGHGTLGGTLGTSTPPVSCPGQASGSAPATFAATWAATYYTAGGHEAAAPSTLSTSGELISTGGENIGLQIPGAGNAASATGSFARSSPNGWSADLTSTEDTNAFDAKCASRKGVTTLKLSGPASVGATYGFGSPRGMTTNGTDVWVANYVDQADSVTEFDASTGAWVRTITGLSNPWSVAYGEGNVFVNSAYANSVTELDANTGAVIGTLSGGSYGFDGIEQEVSDGSHIWFLNDGNNTVTEIDASTGDWIQTLPESPYGFDQPQSAVFDGSNLWVTNMQGDSVTEIDASTGALVRVLSGASYSFKQPWDISFDGSDLWITDYGSNAVTEVNASSGDWVQTLTGGNYGFDQPSWTASDGQHVWVSEGGDNSITEIAAATGSWIQTAPSECNFSAIPLEMLFDGTYIDVDAQTTAPKGSDCVEQFAPANGDLAQTLIG